MKLWIARDSTGLYLFRDKPNQDKHNPKYWDIPYWGCLPINATRFPSVTWENSPQRVELKLIEK